MERIFYSPRRIEIVRDGLYATTRTAAYLGREVLILEHGVDRTICAGLNKTQVDFAKTACLTMDLAESQQRQVIDLVAVGDRAKVVAEMGWPDPDCLRVHAILRAVDLSEHWHQRWVNFCATEKLVEMLATLATLDTLDTLATQS